MLNLAEQPDEGVQLAGIFSRNGNGCLTILRDEPAEGYVSISFTANDETSVADTDAQTLIVPSRLFDSALDLAGYTASPAKARPRRS